MIEPALAHVGQHGLDAEERAHEVDVEHPPVLGFGDGLDAALGVDGGVVDQHVDAAVALDGDGHRGRPALGRRHVEVHTVEVAHVEHVGGDDRCALGREQLGLGPALAACGPGDQRDLPGQSAATPLLCHVSPSTMMRAGYATAQNSEACVPTGGVRRMPVQGSESMNAHVRRWIVVGPMPASASLCFGHG